MVAAVYGGQIITQVKRSFGVKLKLPQQWDGPWCLGGDLNVIRAMEERLGVGGLPYLLLMRAFSDWVNSYSLVDLRLDSAMFTWSNNQVLSLMSRLDRMQYQENRWIFNQLCATWLSLGWRFIIATIIGDSSNAYGALLLSGLSLCGIVATRVKSSTSGRRPRWNVGSVVHHQGED